MSVIAAGSSACGLSQSASKDFSQFLARRQLRWTAVGVADVAQALNKREAWIRIGRRGDSSDEHRGAHRRDEHVGVVEDGFVVDAGEGAARIVRRRHDLNRLDLAADLEHRVRQRPRLHVR